MAAAKEHLWFQKKRSRTLVVVDQLALSENAPVLKDGENSL